ncbi:hypothetical protein FA15DRAFT_703441 [Coprinopsis marcescibilis]|uniref:Uncharacterized protein n=1 Tax=Coprinopsis marcescibilis TaxID=230819 RepID=A0A5C3KYK3_COPMA|nr:hypothetical protein FA15DRAFT_703441 [Coprinopsis marcescibilis]
MRITSPKSLCASHNHDLLHPAQHTAPTEIPALHPIFILPALPLEDSSSYESYERLGQGITESTYAEMETMANCRSKDECPSIVEGVARTNTLTLGFHFPSDS